MNRGRFAKRKQELNSAFIVDWSMDPTLSMDEGYEPDVKEGGERIAEGEPTVDHRSDPQEPREVVACFCGRGVPERVVQQVNRFVARTKTPSPFRMRCTGCGSDLPLFAPRH